MKQSGATPALGAPTLETCSSKAGLISSPIVDSGIPPNQRGGRRDTEKDCGKTDFFWSVALLNIPLRLFFQEIDNTFGPPLLDSNRRATPGVIHEAREDRHLFITYPEPRARQRLDYADFVTVAISLEDTRDLFLHVLSRMAKRRLQKINTRRVSRIGR